MATPGEFQRGDSLEGGGGDDLLWGNGGDGNDVYLFASGESPLRGDLAETILDSGGSDTLVLADALPKDLRLAQKDNTLLIQSGADHWAIVDGAGGSIETFRFADGSELTAAELIGRLADKPVTAETGGRSTRYGGSDTYRFAAGDGRDTIGDSGSWGDDVLRFGDGIAPGDLDVTRSDADLRLIVRDSGERVVVSGWYAGLARSIEAVEFADGTRWTRQATIAQAQGARRLRRIPWSEQLDHGLNQGLKRDAHDAQDLPR